MTELLFWTLVCWVILHFTSGYLKKVFIYCVYMFFQNYNTSYPVFSKLQIGEAKAESIILSQKWGKLIDKYLKRQKRLKGGHVDLSVEKKMLFEETWEPHYRSEWLNEKVDLMINANIVVTNGKRTIAEANAEFDKKFEEADYFKKMEQHGKSSLERIK